MVPITLFETKIERATVNIFGLECSLAYEFVPTTDERLLAIDEILNL